MKQIQLISKNRQNFKHFWTLLKTERTGLLIILIANTISNALMTALPFIMGIAIDDLLKVLNKGSHYQSIFDLVQSTILVPVVLMGIASVLAGLLSYLSEYVMSRVSEAIVVTLREDVTAKLTKLPMNFFDTHQIGDIISRTTSDAKKISDFLVMNVPQMVSSIASLTLGLAMMFYISGTLTVFVLLIMLLSVVTTKWISTKNKIYAEKSQTSLGQLSNVVEELYSGNMIVKSFNLQEEVTEKMENANKSYYELYLKSKFINFSIYPAVRILNQLSFVFSAIASAVLVIQGRMSIGTIQAYLQYVNQISEPVTNSSYVVNSIQNALTAVERIFEILEANEEVPENQDVQTITNPKGEITFDHVKFGYHSDKMLMNDVNFEVKQNQMVAIVGPTGAGKTTLVNLLMRFYEVNQGTILFDGVPINQLSREHLRSLFGMVLQDTWLFEGTVAENIAYGKKDATLEEVVAAARAAQCDHFIRTLPQGYQTVITNGGNSISQGQQQLLTIARILLVNPSIVILDEATSSVDTRTEVDVQKAMNEMLTGRTSFVIAHRLSTIISADIILVMKDGDIVEQGNHEALLAANGMYAQLYQSQF
ncbi:multidrug ABC transporter ATP-binding protein [Enterococcus alcedinis]|uniref:Multidrug ABC transporter ATP-binding protein n=1 Tax=Enterococcus alcedinis TaxID=1274384 RepID=A0A917JGP9_9ENTE|nr:ABC transporter ATP-binding protein [Enterococcus alcedinis]MBP2101942.1 ATP-binding cassette subfamily B protein [Enterococcus alcedinis]GGI65505.1 multidrug ABC transporter ATP-binding protein [Enterococcus alcedinis]